ALGSSNLVMPIDDDLRDALAAFEDTPTAPLLWAVIQRLAAATVSEEQARSVLAAVTDRIPGHRDDAPSVITLTTQREVDLYRALPVAVRMHFNPWLGPDLPMWGRDCPRCDSTIDKSHDSYGMPTYTYLYWCRSCGWRDEQPSDEPTMASI